MQGGIDMNGSKIFVTIILISLSLFTALLLESRMEGLAFLELLIIFVGAIITAAIVFGLWIEEPWAYPLAIVFFAASLANLLWLFTSTKIFLTFAFGVLVNVAGIVMCMSGLGQAEAPAKELETYTVDKTQSKKRKRK